MSVAQGRLGAATQSYGEALAIMKKLTMDDTSNIKWQRDLAESYWKLGDLAERQKKAKEARGYWQQAFEILSGIDKRGLHLSPKDRQELERLRQKVGAAPR